MDTIPLNTQGESYDGIRALADLIRIVKIPNKLSGAIAGEQLCSDFEPSWSSYIFKNKKKSVFFFFSSIFTPTTHSIIVSFCFSYLYLYPHYPWKVILVHTFRPNGVSR